MVDEQPAPTRAAQDGPVAQLDRASDFYSEGCRFDSCRDRQFQSHPFIVSPIYDAHPHGPLSFTNAWAASFRALIQTNEPYLCAERRAPDKDFDATIRLDENGDPHLRSRLWQYRSWQLTRES